ncbi:MAG: adenylate/guanylate cyclase domain-containing protein [Acidimicrobiia bacterium]
MTTNDRTTGALVFTDLAGFTAYTAERGDDAALRLVERFEALAHTLLPEGARVVKQLGDGLFLHFADPATAIPTALSLSETCARSSMEDGPLWIRTGVHVGSALRRGDDLIGHDVNLASRITDLAAAGEVLVSDAARYRDDVPGDVVFEALGPVFVKGIEEPLRLFRASLHPGVH